jgi:hypothetical protein
MFQCDKPTGQTARPLFIYAELGLIDSKAPKSERLRQLAEIITGTRDGRLARTIVNRLWARFFGRGLVEPLDDMEQAAWNQDLLDWLAEDLINHGYDLKQTIELMVTSQAYQLPSVGLGEAAAKDYVFRGPGIRRLSAEEFRDAVAQLTAIWYSKAEFTVTTAEIRASLVAADPLAVALGRPNREQVITSRSDAATTLQALELTNGKTLSAILQRAALMMVEFPVTNDELLERIYRRAFARSPTTGEKASAKEFIGEPPQKEGVEDLLWATVMLPEFQLIY